jgi:dTDP-4-amino-4,6-dideoxygalactose transaminase
MVAPDTRRIAAELAERGIPLIEDCAQAWGLFTLANRRNRARATAAVLSTQTYKLVATGEGGLVIADDPILADSIRALAGDTRIPTPKPVWRGNARMSEITAALALPQLQHLDEVITLLRPLQQRIVELVREAPGATAVIPDDDGVATTNGSHAGVWFSTAEQAQHHAARLYRAGVRCWHPSAGDLHTSEAWPVQPALRGSSAHLHRYLDIQIPILDATDHDQFCLLVRQAMEARA